MDNYSEESISNDEDTEELTILYLQPNTRSSWFQTQMEDMAEKSDLSIKT